MQGYANLFNKAAQTITRLEMVKGIANLSKRDRGNEAYRRAILFYKKALGYVQGERDSARVHLMISECYLAQLFRQIDRERKDRCLISLIVIISKALSLCSDFDEYILGEFQT